MTRNNGLFVYIVFGHSLNTLRRNVIYRLNPATGSFLMSRLFFPPFAVLWLLDVNNLINTHHLTLYYILFCRRHP